MKANSTHISLETAKLLKDCKVESDWNYNLYHNHPIEEGQYFIVEQSYKQPVFYPAYSWREILWEYPEQFFGEKGVRSETGLAQIPEKYYEIYPQYILNLLQQKKYNEADLYFRKHCILIKNNELKL